MPPRLASKSLVVVSHFCLHFQVQSTLRELLVEVRPTNSFTFLFEPSYAFPSHRQSSSHRMELIIIALIAVEAFIVIPTLCIYYFFDLLIPL